MDKELFQFENQPGVRFAFGAAEHFQGTTLRRIVDMATGVLYLQASTDHGTSITPLLDEDGNPVAENVYLKVQMETLSDYNGISRILKTLIDRTYEYLDKHEDGEVEEKSNSVRDCHPLSLREHVQTHPGGYFDAILDDDGRTVRIYPWDPITRQGGYLEVELLEDEGPDDIMALPICAGGKPLGVVFDD